MAFKVEDMVIYGLTSARIDYAEKNIDKCIEENGPKLLLELRTKGTIEIEVKIEAGVTECIDPDYMGRMTDGEKNLLCQRYIEAGWQNCFITHSPMGAIHGKSMVTLTTNKYKVKD